MPKVTFYNSVEFQADENLNTCEIYGNSTNAKLHRW